MGQVDHSKTGQVDHRVNMPRLSFSFLISFALTWWKCLSTTVIHKAMVMGNFYLVASSILQRFVMSSQTN